MKKLHHNMSSGPLIKRVDLGNGVAKMMTSNDEDDDNGGTRTTTAFLQNNGSSSCSSQLYCLLFDVF